MRTTTSILATVAVLGAAVPTIAQAAPPPKGQPARSTQRKQQAPPKKAAPAKPAPAKAAPAKAAPPKPADPPAVAPPPAAVPTVTAAPAAPSPVQPTQRATEPPVHRDAQLLSNSSDIVLPERELNGHYFLAPLSMNLPFITSHVSSSTAVLSTDFPELSDQTGLDLKFFSLAQVFDLQIGLLDRVALRGSLQGSATAPTDPDAALIVAIDGGYSGGLGTTVQAIKTRYFAVSGSVDWTHSENVQVSPLQYVEDIANKIAEDFQDDGELDGDWEPDSDLLFSDLTSDDLSFSAQAAASPHELVGFFAEVGWDAEFDSDDRNDAFLRLGGGASLNFESVGVPVGLLGYYVQRFPMDGENATGLDQTFAGGIYYTGRRYLDLGLEMQRQLEEQDDVEIESLGVAARVRAYF